MRVRVSDVGRQLCHYMALVMILTSVLALAPETAKALVVPNFGGRYIVENPPVQNYRGTRAGIVAPADFTVPDKTNAFMRVVAQKERELLSGIVQTGFTKTGANWEFNNCGSVDFLVSYWEWSYHNSGIFHCGFSDPLPPANYRTPYRVNQRSLSIDPLGKTWAGYIDGLLVFSADVGFDGAALVGAGGEINGEGTTFSGELYGCYGCAGFGGSGTSWQRAASPGGTDWVNIQSSAFWNDSQRWTIGQDIAAFEVSHR